MRCSNVMVGIGLMCSVNAIAGNTYDYRSSCPQSPNKVDKWNFYTCNCTSYDADKLSERGIPFYNYYKGVRWGNASNWINAASQVRVSYNTTPKRGDVAWFSYGHVAFVDYVDGSGNVTISEYNYSPYSYGERTLKKGSSSYPKYFIHL